MQEMRAVSPRSALRFRLRSHFALLDPFQKRPRQFPLSGMALAMDGAQVEKLIAQRILPLLLQEDSLQRQSQLAQPLRLGPRMIVSLAPQELVAGEQAS